MELLFVALAGAILGLVARYSVPGRHTHGVVLVPTIGTGAAAVVWVACTWLAMPWDGGWIWVVTLVVAAAAAGASAWLIGRARARGDEERLAEWAASGVPAAR